MQKGGILIISKDEANIYNKLQIALTQGKPVLWYETPTECYYIDTISGGEITTEIVDDEEVTTYGDIILTKGGKTITITSANAVSESGNIQQTTENFNALMDNIVDSAGNKRFIEGEGTTATIVGIDFLYNKWSLSGSHLMIVLVASIADTTSITSGTILVSYDFPNYIKERIIPFVSELVDAKSFLAYSSTLTTQAFNTGMYKESNILNIKSGNITATADRIVRIQYDLLIDNEYSE